MNFVTSMSSNIKSVEFRVDPIIIRVNEFNEESAGDFADKISKAQSTGQSVVPVIIDSYGGQVYSLMSMMSSIKASSVPVATIVAGKAMSCGSILFSCGAEGLRYMDQDATLMIHDVSNCAIGKIEEIKADVGEADRLNKKIYNLMARNCGKPADYFLKMLHSKSHADWYLSAKEAKKHNLANKLSVPKLTCNINVEYKLV